MKVASLKSGRDGALVVVSRDLRRALSAKSVVPTLQAALDDWTNVYPRLAALANAIEREPELGFPFDERACASPLPRAYQWADGSAYVNHVELVRKARRADMPPSFWTDPLMYQGGSDAFLGPRDPIIAADEVMGNRRGGRGRRHRRRHAGQRFPRGGAGANPPRDAGQRCVVAQPDPGRTRQGLRLLPVEALIGVLAGRRDAGRTGRRLGRRQAPSAAPCRCQRQAVRPRRGRRRHDLRLRKADRACRKDPPA